MFVHVAVRAELHVAQRTAGIDGSVFVERAIEYRAVVLDDRGFPERGFLNVTTLPDFNFMPIKRGLDHARSEADMDVRVSAFVLQQKDQTFEITEQDSFCAF
jgi:hypothetical protein